LRRGWSPRAHQLDLLAKARDNRSALLIAPTGAGKTLAGFLPTLVELGTPRSKSAKTFSTGRRCADRRPAYALHFAAEGAGSGHRANLESRLPI
jgi:ATP-dependent helicase YprA (DUF1998 family)